MNKKNWAWMLLIIFFVGALGSIVLSRLIFPYFSNIKGLSWLGKLSTSAPIVINRTQEVQLNEGVNLIDLIRQSGNFTVGIYGPRNNFLGNGMIVTSDGLILTANSIIVGQTAVSVTTNDGKNFPAALKTMDSKANLALLFISANNLPVAQFDDAANLQAGQRVLFVGRGNLKFEHQALAGFVTQSLANELDQKQISTDAVLSTDYVGGPIVNLSGQVVGLTSNLNQNIIAENLKIFLNNYLATTQTK